MRAKLYYFCAFLHQSAKLIRGWSCEGGLPTVSANTRTLSWEARKYCLASFRLGFCDFRYSCDNQLYKKLWDGCCTFQHYIHDLDGLPDLRFFKFYNKYTPHSLCEYLAGYSGTPLPPRGLPSPPPPTNPAGYCVTRRDVVLFLQDSNAW